ncbi:hypothetical protein VKT23_016882 [Stygiomarasmius scandens]|uniref:Uncharacterized protein n=1 Tax=Marasmiellus scandens TaxID=2682957 RepID=A0ABR1IWR1_9AGAR
MVADGFSYNRGQSIPDYVNTLFRHRYLREPKGRIAGGNKRGSWDKIEHATPNWSDWQGLFPGGRHQQEIPDWQTRDKPKSTSVPAQPTTIPNESLGASSSPSRQETGTSTTKFMTEPLSTTISKSSSNSELTINPHATTVSSSVPASVLITTMSYGVSTTVTTTTSKITAVTRTPISDGSSSINTSTILGIVFAILSFLILLALFLFFLCRRRKKLAEKRTIIPHHYGDSTDYKKPGSFHLGISDLYSESVASWNETSIAPSDSISQAHLKALPRRSPAPAVPLTELSALSEGTEETITGNSATTDGSTKSDASSTEVESLPAVGTVGYGTDLKKVHDDEEQDTDDNSSMSSITIGPRSRSRNPNLPIITMTAATPTPPSTVVSGN